MEHPPALSALLPEATDGGELGSIEPPLALRLLRPITLVVWLMVFCVQLETLLTSSGAVANPTNWLIPGLLTLLFAAVHVQFWFDESQQGRRVHLALDRMRGRIYEDESTGLPNGRYLLFELRRQMMRSLRAGHGFSLLLTDVVGWEALRGEHERLVAAFARACRQSVGAGDFVAHLEGAVFAAIVFDDEQATSTAKAQGLHLSIASCIPLASAGEVYPTVSITGYTGEIEVTDFLRRAQLDLASARGRYAVADAGVRSRTPAA